MEITKIRELAQRFRTAIENVPVKSRPIGMELFPRGACGDTSLLFGAYLVDHSITGFKWMSGCRGDVRDNTWTSHAWLQRDNLVVDLTADQFPDAPMGLIIMSPSPWHAQFNGEDGGSGDFRDRSNVDQLARLYRRLLQDLPSLP
ncbi:hypothetical protein [Comamonas sp. SY3]|uniref:hypothetical protein n=1 Tax=Comamonas sp. SY3 TaxID=3243601 RepID=UPI0035947F9B